MNTDRQIDELFDKWVDLPEPLDNMPLIADWFRYAKANGCKESCEHLEEFFTRWYENQSIDAVNECGVPLHMLGADGGAMIYGWT